jgi:hypothetical protein
MVVNSSAINKWFLSRVQYQFTFNSVPTVLTHAFVSVSLHVILDFQFIDTWYTYEMPSRYACNLIIFCALTNNTTRNNAAKSYYFWVYKRYNQILAKLQNVLEFTTLRVKTLWGYSMFLLKRHVYIN